MASADYFVGSTTSNLAHVVGGLRFGVKHKLARTYVDAAHLPATSRDAYSFVRRLFPEKYAYETGLMNDERARYRNMTHILLDRLESGPFTKGLPFDSRI